MFVIVKKTTSNGSPTSTIYWHKGTKTISSYNRTLFLVLQMYENYSYLCNGSRNDYNCYFANDLYNQLKICINIYYYITNTIQPSKTGIFAARPKL